MSLLEKRFAFEKIMTFADGDWIFKEGDHNRDLFIIQEGEVEIIKHSPQGEMKLARFEKGDFFGDMALLQGGPRFAGARAKGETRLLILQPGGFLLKIRRDPTFAFEMLQQLSHRIKVSNERMLGLIQQGGITLDKAQEVLNSIEGK
ncbi:MAG: cyclic nucleotide-binding domain-containing protein [Bacteriovoracaceae bacterium]|nr:cyclic nucleotide-binding domain-containing protein [Bacteriovoracaceae bacterium]